MIRKTLFALALALVLVAPVAASPSQFSLTGRVVDARVSFDLTTVELTVRVKGEGDYRLVIADSDDALTIAAAFAGGGRLVVVVTGELKPEPGATAKLLATDVDCVAGNCSGL